MTCLNKLLFIFCLDVPPLEDMSEVLKQIEELKKLKERKQEQTETKSAKSYTSKEPVSELYNGKENVSDVTESDRQKTNPIGKSNNKVTNTPEETKIRETAFGGMRKGFLFGSSTKSNPVKQEKKDNAGLTKSGAGGEQKTKATLEDIPFLKKQEKDVGERLKIPEVQETMNKTAENLSKNQEWVTDDLLNKLGENQSVLKGFQNPEYIKIIGEFQSDPQRAMEKYKDHKNFQEFFKEFCKLMGDHFGVLGSKQPTPQTSNGVSSGPEIQTVSESDGAQMSVHSSTNPNQPTSEDEKKMQEILSDPEVQSILRDPKVVEFFGKARTSPDAAQSLVHNSDNEFKQKIQKLVSVGLLQFQV